MRDDIAAQLRLDNAARFIHQFRRTNIGVGWWSTQSPASAPPSSSTCSRRPSGGPRSSMPRHAAMREARQRAEETPAPPRYHAGLGADVHAIAYRPPSSAASSASSRRSRSGWASTDRRAHRRPYRAAVVRQGYYQEIGRAGRNSKPSRAVLLHSFVDTRRTSSSSSATIPTSTSSSRRWRRRSPPPARTRRPRKRSPRGEGEDGDRAEALEAGIHGADPDWRRA